MESNVFDTALILEGGGMRGAYTAGIMAHLIEQGVFFDYVAGISSGSSNTVNYIARDAVRARKSFVDFAGHPKLGSWRTWIQGKGMFNAKHIYEEAPLPDGPLPFDYETFMANPARWRLGSFNTELGETIYWDRESITDRINLMRKVWASSAIPLMMPSVTLDGTMYVDGALGAGGGIPLPIAQQEGFTKFFVVLTQERSYVKTPYKGGGFATFFYRKHPNVAMGIAGRNEKYNATREELFELERQGTALLVMPEQMKAANNTRDVGLLGECYDQAKEQAVREFPAWKEFLGI
ncbi:MAG: patatin family protein [Propionibacteriaceae bacterium]|nr:patatin family protein [Propionibacteriaceae bacterium]